MRLAPLIALLLASCGTDVRSMPSHETDDSDVDAGVGGGGGGGGGGEAIVADARTPPGDGIPQGLTPCEEAVYHSDFTWVQRTVFDVSCATSDCHGGASPRAELDLRSGAAHASLVNVASTQFDGWTRVVPGSSPDSMLMVQLGAESGPALEGTMPWGQPRLCEPQIEAIRRWIVAGAANN